MLKENKRFFEICGIDKLHKLGITGKGVKIAIFDKKFNTQSDGAKKIYHRKVIGINGFDNNEISSHGSAVAHIIHQTCPDATIYCLTPTTENIIWCVNNNIDIINVSMKLFSKNGFEEALNEFVALGGWMFSSAGNTDEDSNLGIPAGYENCVAVGAVHLMGDNYKGDKIKRASYSSFTKEEKEFIWEMVEIMGFSGIYVMTPKYPDIDNKGNYHSFPFNGTSGSSPFIAGMAGLYKQIFGKVDLNQFREFLYRHTIDLEEEGYDKETGHGLHIAPSTDNIAEIDMWIDNHIFQINKISKVSDVAPQIIDDRTFVPIRWISENLGFEVGWNTTEYKVTIKTSDTEVILFAPKNGVNRNDYYINGVKQYMDTYPRIIQDRTLVPIRFVAEALGCDIFWYNNERKVKIIKW